MRIIHDCQSNSERWLGFLKGPEMPSALMSADTEHSPWAQGHTGHTEHTRPSGHSVHTRPIGHIGYMGHTGFLILPTFVL